MAAYRKDILEHMYADIAPYDTDEILRHEWLNSRGAIPRFERSAIEIRLPDIQECPQADMAVLWAIANVIKSHVMERWINLDEQDAFETKDLVSILELTAADGAQAVIKDAAFLRAFGISGKSAKAGEIWRELIPAGKVPAEFRGALEVISKDGTLSRRILKATGNKPTRKRLREVYTKLCACLANEEMFHAG